MCRGRAHDDVFIYRDAEVREAGQEGSNELFLGLTADEIGERGDMIEAVVSERLVYQIHITGVPGFNRPMKCGGYGFRHGEPPSVAN